MPPASIYITLQPILLSVASSFPAGQALPEQEHKGLSKPK
jgi:hypothetical protein